MQRCCEALGARATTSVRSLVSCSAKYLLSTFVERDLAGAEAKGESGHSGDTKVRQ
jgi:hypothetical protein